MGEGEGGGGWVVTPSLLGKERADENYAEGKAGARIEFITIFNQVRRISGIRQAIVSSRIEFSVGVWMEKSRGEVDGSRFDRATPSGEPKAKLQP